ncbi:hypothetical protein [Microvirga pudoricolor]|uniref:hypothetical protein n=1 Tax=Microvirga pudoricolor TaxID=2778729 RepID=UPI00194F258B|nr:hypothetical protein [Microvirga pudoricolor]MBM6594710.1 hypothetical protein [Microvirga pudoricolor]
MSNVITLSSHRKRAQPSPPSVAERRAAIASDLIHLIDQVRDVTERAASLSGPSVEIERSAQHLLDAITALERGVDALTDDGEWVPF